MIRDRNNSPCRIWSFDGVALRPINGRIEALVTICDLDLRRKRFHLFRLLSATGGTDELDIALAQARRSGLYQDVIDKTVLLCQ